MSSDFDSCSTCLKSNKECTCSLLQISENDYEEMDLENLPPEHLEWIDKNIQLSLAKEESLNIFGKIQTFCESSWVPILDNLNLQDLFEFLYPDQAEFEDNLLNQ